MADKETLLHCSFCGKSQKEVKHLIAGPSATAVCDECVALCVDILKELRTKEEKIAEKQGEIRNLEKQARELAGVSDLLTRARADLAALQK